MQSDMQPIIVGVGQETWRERDLQRTPVDALQAVLTRAASDSASVQTLAAIDAMVHVPFLLNQVPELAAAMPVNPGAAVCGRLGIDAAQYTADVGGNLPQQLINDFARRLRRGEHRVVALAGVELLSTFLGTLRAGQPMPDWSTGRGDSATCLGATPVMTAATEKAHSLYEPINAYPLFESALRHEQGLNSADHGKLLGGLIHRMSRVAEANPHAWRREVIAADAAVSTDGGNRMICTPYTKIMNSVLAVDQAAAVILTTVGEARRLDIDEERWIYLAGGAGARDAWFLGERQSLTRSPALEASVAAALAQAGSTVEALTHFDLYSCFPSAVQVACKAVGIALDDPRGLTVTGGMSLFGGPGNNYSLHAVASMTDALRATTDGSGLVTANGGYLTKHAVGIYTRRAPTMIGDEVDETALQGSLGADDGPRLADEGQGVLSIEGHTVCWRGDTPEQAIALGRLADGRRCVAVSRDERVLASLADEDWVGRSVAIEHRDGLNTLRL